MMQEYRCRGCGWLLFKGKLKDALIQIKCRKGDCHHMNTIGTLAKERAAVVS